MHGRVYVSVCVLVWFRPPGSGSTVSVNLSEIFSFDSSSGLILLTVPKCAQNVCIRHICVCDCLDWPSHSLCRWPRSHAPRDRPFYGGSALVLLLAFRWFLLVRVPSPSISGDLQIAPHICCLSPAQVWPALGLSHVCRFDICGSGGFKSLEVPIQYFH